MKQKNKFFLFKVSILKFMKQDIIDFQNKFYKKSVCIISDCFVPTRNSLPDDI